MFYDPHHPAVLCYDHAWLQRMHTQKENGSESVENLERICELTEEFLKMGLDELSVSPAMVLPLRKKIRECA